MRNFINIFIIFVILFFVVFGIYKYCSIDDIATGEFLVSEVSFDGNYVLNAYVINGGSLSADHVRVELFDKNKNIYKNIYWKYPYNDYDFDMHFIDNDHVIINDVLLNIHKDKYNWRLDDWYKIKNWVRSKFNRDSVISTYLNLHIVIGSPLE